jgi:hypothetical protein
MASIWYKLMVIENSSDLSSVACGEHDSKRLLRLDEKIWHTRIMSSNYKKPVNEWLCVRKREALEVLVRMCMIA